MQINSDSALARRKDYKRDTSIALVEFNTQVPYIYKKNNSSYCMILFLQQKSALDYARIWSHLI